MGPGGVPFITTHDGRTIRYPHPDIKVNDTISLDLETGKITKHIKYHIGNICMITGGKNTGRVGILKELEPHPGADTIAYIEDLAQRSFSTLGSYVFIIGESNKPMVTLPKGGGVKLTILEQRSQKLQKLQ